MQNNVTDLSQKLQRSLDNNYNVIDMPAVVEIISTLEKTTVTKELLETTRLGKYINELRRKTTNESLAKRAKDLVKKWRGLILPEANGQIKTASISSERSNSPDVSQLKNRKRPNKDKSEVNAKRSVLNGQREFDFSDNSNCSIKDLKKTEVIFINSDSNSSMPEQSNDSFSTTATTRSQPPETFEETVPQPKKRGRKKGSKNHKNLIVAAEESFSNKLSAISRNSKVKTTQELLADLQNRSAKPDIELRAAQLTENLSRIEQKLNPQKKINTNVQPIKKEAPAKNDSKANSVKSEPLDDIKFTRIKQENDAGSSRVSTPDVVIVPSDDEIVDVVGDTPIPEPPKVEPLTIEGILSKLPPVDQSTLDEQDEHPVCTCPVPALEVDNITVQIVGEEKEPYNSIFSSSPTHTEEETFKPVKSDIVPDEEDENVINCPTRLYLQEIYKLESVNDSSYETLKNKCIVNVNGNYGIKTELTEPVLEENGLYVNIVPTLSSLRKDLSENSYLPCENFNKYSISIDSDSNQISSNNCDTVKTISDSKKEIQFREWHETLDVESYNGETLRILPYVIID